MDSKVLHDLTQMVKAMSEGDFYRELSIKVEEGTEQTLEMKAEIMSKLEGQNTIGELRQDLVDEILAQLNG
ncbi:MAG TPA: hypothetical protein VJM80_05200 [bacterium]|nr:hypothetical protein [bacterium]